MSSPYCVSSLATKEARSASSLHGEKSRSRGAAHRRTWWASASAAATLSTFKVRHLASSPSPTHAQACIYITSFNLRQTSWSHPRKAVAITARRHMPLRPHRTSARAQKSVIGRCRAHPCQLTYACGQTYDWVRAMPPFAASQRS